jgi:hypothetical protein
VRVGLPEKLHIACLSQLPERIEHLRGIKPELVNYNTRQGEGNFKLSLVFPKQVKKYPVCRQVTVGSYLPEDGLIHEVIIIIMLMSHLEKAITPESERLMNLEIEADGFFL